MKDLQDLKQSCTGKAKHVETDADKLKRGSEETVFASVSVDR